jgi:hypothetical protein
VLAAVEILQEALPDMLLVAVVAMGWAVAVTGLEAMMEVDWEAAARGWAVAVRGLAEVARG